MANPIKIYKTLEEAYNALLKGFRSIKNRKIVAVIAQMASHGPTHYAKANKTYISHNSFLLLGIFLSLPNHEACQHLD